ncbi:hypothetical protein IHE45_04G177200 [Dioscorea alata]|uniref:Uncharacterized protein n=1 Tax=Dioscorea alata TaxID=55571 RepID=A0ACB7WHP3_DIOAL|nr:hypothetical protein IHE45_04G177200 [Dioscorea alata]
MTTSMSTSERCGACSDKEGTCTHGFTDLNRTVPLFPETNHDPDSLQEFQFFGHDDSVAWLFNEPKIPEPRAPEERPSFKYLDDLRHACNPARLTFDVCLSNSTSSPDVIQHHSQSLEVPAMGHHAASTSATIVSLYFSFFPVSFCFHHHHHHHHHHQCHSPAAPSPMRQAGMQRKAVASTP